MKTLRLCLLAAVVATLASASRAQTRTVDPERSSVTIHVSRSGVLSFMGDNHEISAPVSSGSVDETGRTVVIKLRADQLRVLDPSLSPEKRAEVQQRMLSPDVLDVSKYPDIEFRSTAVQNQGAQWRVDGLLTLHGQSRPVSVVVTGSNGSYKGRATVKQTQFGIKPVRVGGGTVRVKDDVQIEFTIVTK